MTQPVEGESVGGETGRAVDVGGECGRVLMSFGFRVSSWGGGSRWMRVVKVEVERERVLEERGWRRGGGAGGSGNWELRVWSLESRVGRKLEVRGGGGGKF